MANERMARLRLSEPGTLSIGVPHDAREQDFAAIGKATLGLIHNLTGCNCLSGRIRVVLEDDWSEVINVQLQGVQARG